MARRVKRVVKRAVEKKEAPLEHYGEAWLGGEAHVGDADQTPATTKLLQNLRASQAFVLGFGFASGLILGIGLATLLTRRRRA